MQENKRVTVPFISIHTVVYKAQCETLANLQNLQNAINSNGMRSITRWQKSISQWKKYQIGGWHSVHFLLSMRLMIIHHLLSFQHY